MSFRDVIENTIAERQAKLALPIVGMVVGYDEETHLATVRCTSRSANKFDFYELPWITEAPGMYNPAPEEGTHVIVGFRMGDDQCPVILGRYDPNYTSTIKQKSIRQVETMLTRTEGRLI